MVDNEANKDHHEIDAHQEIGGGLAYPDTVTASVFTKLEHYSASNREGLAGRNLKLTLLEVCTS